MGMNGSLGLVSALLASATACKATVERDVAFDSAGVSVRVASAEERKLPWRASPVATLGAADGRSDDLRVERLGQVATDGRERIYVVDHLNSALSAFGADGRKLWQRGRAGGGPGEFRFPSFLRVAQSGEIQVTDQGKGSLVRFDRDGAVLSEISFLAHGYPHSAIYLNGDTVVIHELEAAAWVLRLKVQSEVIEFARAPISTLGTARLRCGAGTFTIKGAPRLLGPNIVWNVSGGKVVVAVESEYVLRSFQAGHLATIVRRDIAPRRTTAADVERLYPQGTWMGRRDCKTDGEILMRQFGIEPHLPILRGVLVAPDGAVWVERFTFPDEETQVDIFGSDGSFSGTAVGVGRPVGFLSKGRFVALVSDDGSGLYQIRVYQRQPAPW